MKIPEFALNQEGLVQLLTRWTISLALFVMSDFFD